MAKRSINTNLCSFPNCKRESSVIWLGVGVCEKHFEWITNNDLETAYKKLGISEDKKKENKIKFKRRMVQMGHPMAKKNFRKRGDKILKNKNVVFDGNYLLKSISFEESSEYDSEFEFDESDDSYRS
jgi:hypothetical protein